MLRKAVFSFFVLSGLFIPAQFALANVATTSFETTNGTTTPTDGGSAINTGDGSGWNGSWVVGWGTTGTQYDNSKSYSGSWSILQDTGSTNDEPDLYRLLSTPVTNGKLSFAVQKNKTDRNNATVVLANGGLSSSYRATLFTFVPDNYYGGSYGGNGDIGAYDGASEVQIADNFQATSTWYFVEIYFDCDTDTYDIFVDGEKINSAPLDFYAPQSQIDRVWIQTGASQSSGPNDTPGSQIWWDQVRIVSFNVATTSFETTNGTTTPTDGGAIEFTGDGGGWNGTWETDWWGGTDYYSQYDNSKSYQGSWAFLQDTGSTNAETDAYRLLETPITHGKVSFAVQKNKTDRNHSLVLLNNGGLSSAYRAAMFAFAPDDYYGGSPGGNGDVAAYDGTSEVVIADNFQATSTWYFVEIYFDCDTDTYDIFVDGEKLNSSPLDFYEPQSQIDRVWVRTGSSQSSGGSDTPGSQTWWDEVKVVGE